MSWLKDAKSDKVIQLVTQLDLYLEVASSLFKRSLKPFKKKVTTKQRAIYPIEP